LKFLSDELQPFHIRGSSHEDKGVQQHTNQTIKDTMKSKRKGTLLQLTVKELKNDLKSSANNRLEGVTTQVHRNRLNAIKNNIAKFGYKKGLPVIVNEELVICDGHHRVRACIELGVEAYVLIDPDARVEDYAQISASANRWNLNDFIKAAVNNGSKAAKIIEFLMEKYCFSANIVIKIEFGIKLVMHRAIEMIQSDTIHFSDIEETKRKCQHIRDCLDLTPIKDNRMVLAIAGLMEHEHYVPEVMLRKLTQKGGEVYGTSTLKQAKEQLQHIYNHGSRSRKIYFLD
jgi:hypothetical protein